MNNLSTIVVYLRRIFAHINHYLTSLMSVQKKRTTPKRDERLDAVTATIVELMDKVDLYHYNKLAYLFEYFYIKNFGGRFSKEKFVKLPHGPVIGNYPKQIENLVNDHIIDAPIDEVKKDRVVDEKHYPGVYMTKNENTEKNSVHTPLVRGMIENIIEKYGSLSHAELEELVYATPPVEAYLSLVGTRFGPPKIGGYVLESRCIKITENQSENAEALRFIAELESSHTENTEEEKAAFEEEFKWLKKIAV